MEVLFKIIFGILIQSWEIFCDASVYLLFGFIVAGIIHFLIPDDKIAKLLGGKGIKPIFFASLLGIPIPLCSCGVIPMAIGLRKKGASKSATLSFLISTPETGVDSLFISYALLDPLMTILRPILAIITAILTGISHSLFGNPKDDDLGVDLNPKDCGCAEDRCKDESCEIHVPVSIWGKIKKGLRFAFIELLGDLAKWLILGFLIAGLIAYLVPEDMVKIYLGNEWVSMLVMLVVGIPLYVCATASTPIAAALMVKGLHPGAALVLLLAGPAFNIATITVVARYFGKRSLLIYLSGIVICSFFFGFLLDKIYLFSGINPQAVIGKAGEFIPPFLGNLGAILLLILMPYAWYKMSHKK